MNNQNQIICENCGHEYFITRKRKIQLCVPCMREAIEECDQVLEEAEVFEKEMKSRGLW